MGNRHAISQWVTILAGLLLLAGTLTAQRSYAPRSRNEAPASLAAPGIPPDATPPPFSAPGYPQASTVAPPPQAAAPRPGQTLGLTQHESQPLNLRDTFYALSQRQGTLPINIWFPGAPVLGNTEIAQGAAVAQAIALRTGYLPVRVTSRPQMVQGMFNVMIGTVEELGGFISPQENAAIKNGYLLLRRLHSNTYVLLITGRNAHGLQSAILTLGIAREQLPGVASASIKDVYLPTAPPFLRREPLKAQTTYTFSDLQMAGTDISARAGGVLRMEFSLPGDFSPEKKGEIQADFHFSGTTPAQQISARINGRDHKPVAAATHAAPDNNRYASLSLPLAELQQGYNFVDFAFHAGNTAAQLPKVPVIYNDSTLVTPDFTISPQLPNLRLTGLTGYPFIGQPDGSEILVFLAGPSIDVIESAWTFMARLAQTANTLLYAAEYSTTLVDTSRHIIAIGSRDDLPAEWQALLPKALFEDVLIAPEAVEKEGTNLKQAISGLYRSAHQAIVDPHATPPPRTEERAPPENKAERAYLANEPPLKDKHGWLLLITSTSPGQLKERIDQLVEPAFWDKIAGWRFYWHRNSLDAYEEPVTNVDAVNEDRRRHDRMVEMPLGETYPFRQWVIAVIITLLVFMISMLRALNRLYQRGGYRY